MVFSKITRTWGRAILLAERFSRRAIDVAVDARKVDARLIRISIRALVYTRTHARTHAHVRAYARSILLSVRARPWAHRGLNNKTRMYTGNDRGERGGKRPRGAHKASPRTYPPPRRRPTRRRRRRAAFPQAENARPIRGSSPGGGIALFPLPPSPACPPRRPVISSSRSPGLPGRGSAPSCTTVRSSVRPLGRCIAPRRSVRRGRVRKSPRGFRRLPDSPE